MSDAYKVGISLLMQSNHAQVLGMLSKELLGVNAKVKDLAGNFGKLKLAIGGGLAIYGGEKMLRVLGGLVEHGSKIVHQQEMLRIAGVRNLEVVEATRRAYEVSGRVQTTTISGNLKHIGELRYAFGSMEQASQYIERVSKANAILNSIKGGGHDEVWSLIKSLEEKGLTSKPQEFMRYIDIMTKATEASNGRVTPQQFFNAFKYGRTSMLGWDETFVGQYLPRAIQSFTGAGGGGGGYGGPGNAIMSAFAAVVNGQMNKFPAEQFKQLGLVDRFQTIPGSSKGVAEITGRSLFQKNPYEWVQSVLMPQLAAQGITSDEAIQEKVSRLFPNRTAGGLMTMFALQGRFHEGDNSPWEKDAKMTRDAMPTLKAFQELMRNDPTLAMQAFRAQWESLKEALGYASVGPAFRGMRALTSGITALTQAAGNHPDVVKGIFVGFASLATLMLGAGGIAILGALGPTGWLILGLSALAAVLTAVYPMIHQILGDGNKVKNRTKHNPGESPLHWWNRKTHKGVDWDGVGPAGPGKTMSWPKHVFGPNGELINESTVNVGKRGPLIKPFIPGVGHGDAVKPFIELRPPVERLNRNIERLNGNIESGGGVGGGGGASGGGSTSSGSWWDRLKNFGTGGGGPSGGSLSKSMFSGGSIGGGGAVPSGVAKPGTAPMGKHVGDAIDASPVPGGVLAMAAKLSGDPGKLQKFMADMGHPKSGAWCGEFAASVVRRSGGTPPKGAALADNWKSYGLPDATPHVGDIAVRNYHVHGHGHVGFVSKVNPDGSFVMEGGNQGGHTFMTRRGGYIFRKPPKDVVDRLIGSGATQDSGAIPPPAKRDIHMNHTSILDGRVVARSTMKHIVGWGNGPTRAPRLHDPLSTSPIPV